MGCALAAVLLLLGWQPWRRAAERPIGPLASALAAPVAALATLYGNAGRLTFPPRQYLDWVLLAGFAAVPLIALRGGRRALSLGLFAAGAAALAYFPTASLRARYWGDDRWLWMAALVGVFTALYWVAQRTFASRGPDAPAAFGLVALAAAPTLGFSGTGLAALLVASVGGTALLVAALSLWRRDLRPSEGLAGPLAVLLAGLVTSGVLFAETPRTCGLVLLAAPLAMLVPASGARARLARMAAVLAAAGWAAYTVHSQAAANPYG